MTSLLALPAGRRSKLLVALAALVVVVALGALSGRLDGVITEDPAASLPRDAESLAALEAVRRFPAGETTPAVTVFRRDGGLTIRDRRFVDAQRRGLQERRLPTAQDTPPAQIAPDGTTAVLVTPLRTTDDVVLADATQRLRDRLADAPVGLAVAVTGGAALSADLSQVFEGADVTLLLVAGLVVIVLLILNYRSPVFWLIPFGVVLAAEAANRGVGYLLAGAGLTIDPAGSGIASVLVFGAATDYALLLVARYREELRRHGDEHEAMRLALRSAGPTIVASGLTVAAALVTLLLCQVRGTQSIGPLAATGVLLAMLLTLTLLPVLLLLTGRRAFWPLIPRAGSGTEDPARSVWGRIGQAVARRPRPVWVAGFAVLVVMALGLTQLQSSLGPGGEFTREPEAVTGGELLARAFPSGTTAPADVIVSDRSRARAVRSALQDRRDLVASVTEPVGGPPGARLSMILRADPESSAAQDQVPELRRVARAAGGDAVLVGGSTAEDYDLREAARRDTIVVVPVALVLVLVILMVLLRAPALPLLLVVSVVASFAAALGAGAVVFEQVFGFTGSDASLPLLAFVFLFALGVDYTIFLTARVREEAAHVGTRSGMTRALAATGAVITSAGLVLTGTFGVLGVLPLVVLAQLGFVIGLGVLLDTLLVRSIIVPALIYDLGPRVWWPSALAREDDHPGHARPGARHREAPAPGPA